MHLPAHDENCRGMCFLHRRSRFQPEVMTTITHLPMLTRMGLYVQLNVVVAASVPDMPLYAWTELVKPMHLRRCQTVRDCTSDSDGQT